MDGNAAAGRIQRASQWRGSLEGVAQKVWGAEIPKTCRRPTGGRWVLSPMGPSGPIRPKLGTIGPFEGLLVPVGPSKALEAGLPFRGFGHHLAVGLALIWSRANCPLSHTLRSLGPSDPRSLHLLACLSVSRDPRDQRAPVKLRGCLSISVHAEVRAYLCWNKSPSRDLILPM